MQECPRVADWLVKYPAETDVDQTWRLLQSLLLVNWSWDQFIWDLRELQRLLTRAPPEFNYLFVTDFLKARAAYLAATECFNCEQLSVLVALGTKRVQFASIYYRLLVAALMEVQKDHAGTGFQTERCERLFQVAIKGVERKYTQILQLIALVPIALEHPDHEIHGHSLESWVRGEVRRDGQWRSAAPPEVEVCVSAEHHGRHRLVRPGARDMIRSLQRNQDVRSYGAKGSPGSRSSSTGLPPVLHFKVIASCLREWNEVNSSA